MTSGFERVESDAIAILLMTAEDYIVNRFFIKFFFDKTSLLILIVVSCQPWRNLVSAQTLICGKISKYHYPEIKPLFRGVVVTTIQS